MKDGASSRREAEIHGAAFRLVAERGYAGVSMLAIAKEANASNETLYRWYGDKRGLFLTMVAANAESSRIAIDEAIESGRAPLLALEAIAPVLLGMLLGEKTIILNRAAAADTTGELGAAIAAAGRDALAPRITQLIERAISQGEIDAPSAETAMEWFIALLAGDQQIRRVNRILGEPGVADIERRSRAAVQAFRHLCRID